jgi:hypothetical protein
LKKGFNVKTLGWLLEYVKNQLIMKRQEISGYGLDFSNLQKPGLPSGKFRHCDVQELMSVVNKGNADIEGFVSQIVPENEKDLVITIPADTRFGLALCDHVRSIIGAKIELSVGEAQKQDAPPFVIVKRPYKRKKKIEFSPNKFFSKADLYSFFVHCDDLKGSNDKSWTISVGDYLSFAIVRLVEVLQMNDKKIQVVWCDLSDDNTPQWDFNEYFWLIQPDQIC